MDIITLALAKKFATKISAGYSKVEVDGMDIIFTLNDGSQVTLTVPAPADGVSVTGLDINESNELICTMSDGSTINAGEVPVADLSEYAKIEYVDEENEKLKEELDNMKMIYNAMPKVSDEGSNLTLDNTAECPVYDIELSPSALEQETTSGKNLLDLSSEPIINLYASKTFVEPKIEITKTYANQNAFCLFEIGNASDLNGINLKLTGTCLASGTTKGELKLGYANANGSNRTSISDTNQISQGTFEINMTVDGTTYSTKKVVVWLYSDTTQTGNIGDKIVYENVMVSTTGGEYEPYTGGIASPNPQYPQQIHTVSGDNEIYMDSKNVLETIDWNTGAISNDGSVNTSST